MDKKSNYILVLILSIHFYAHAQMDSVIHLPPIEISALANNIQPAGSQYDVIDTLDLLGNNYGGFAHLLSINSGLYAKTISPGSSSSPSIRGAASAHTLILWNGISLTNPMIGQFDLSLFPVDIDNSIAINYGGNSARWGSGAIGGIVDIRSAVPNQKKLEFTADTEVGSFGFRKGGIHLAFIGGKISSVTKMHTRSAENNYPYMLEGGDKKRLVNGNYRSINYSEDISIHFKNNQKIGIHFLGNNSFRRIPALSTQNYSDAAQNDQNTWIVADWQYVRNKSLYKSRIGFLHDNITYWEHHDAPDPSSQYSRSNQWTCEGEAVSNVFDGHLFESGFSLKYTNALVNDSYAKAQKMLVAGIFQSFTLIYPRIKSTLIFREEIDDRNEIQFLPSLGADWELIPKLFLKGRIARNFHRPSLNDLFWQPGGNPNLKVERGWSQDISFSYSRKTESIHIGTEIRLFNSGIHNRILWTFNPGDSFWHPENIGDVISRGVEPNIFFTHQLKNFRYKINLGANVISSTALQDLEIPQIKVGEQLIYVPREKVFGSFALSCKRFVFLYRFLYNGEVRGINDIIPSFSISGLLLQYSMPIKDFAIKGHVNVENLWNESYRIIERRPMPGRSISIGLTFNYSKD